ncbi:recombinase family protein, partial [Streptomyces lasiicapitis]|uniref:recombinase family protein n=1 Tax=Streptomyces lasiicapitis TaxID=1923961 RepID=UPI00364B59CE
MLRFAFYGRVSTEDQQDPAASRAWQLARATALTEAHGPVVAEYFDIGQSRAIPWKRRPRAADLLTALADPARDFDAVVIGEPQRAFYGNQYGLTHPLFVHYGVQLWVPEVGGPIDPESEAHDLVMSVFGGMSKAERSRIKLRVRTAMATQARLEGRFLGGRPPYGYRLADAGPHPHPAKAAEGRRAHRLEIDPATGPVVQRIFTDYLAGYGIYALAQRLTDDHIPCPSAADPDRNPHRSGIAWSKSAIRAILTNPRYTGHQVWNRQHKQETLIDVNDVGLGHTTTLRWNPKQEWIYSEHPAHPALISRETFDAVQQRLASRGPASTGRTVLRTRHAYALKGLIFHTQCGRRMQGNWANSRAHYRCRFPAEYALANRLAHPLNVYLCEDSVLPPLDAWLATAFAPKHLHASLTALEQAQPCQDPRLTASQRTIKDCDRKLKRYRAALEAGADPALINEWTSEITAQRAAAQAQLAAASASPDQPIRRLTKAEIHTLVETLSGLLAVLNRADPADKLEVYRQLGLRLEYDHQTQKVGGRGVGRHHTQGYGRVGAGGVCPPPPQTT